MRWYHILYTIKARCLNESCANYDSNYVSQFGAKSVEIASIETQASNDANYDSRLIFLRFVPRTTTLLESVFFRLPTKPPLLFRSPCTSPQVLNNFE